MSSHCPSYASFLSCASYSLQRAYTLQDGLLVQHASIVDQDVHFAPYFIGNVVHCLGVFQITLLEEPDMSAMLTPETYSMQILYSLSVIQELGGHVLRHKRHMISVLRNEGTSIICTAASPKAWASFCTSASLAELRPTRNSSAFSS